MNFKKILWPVKNTSYIEFEIENWDNNDSIWDVVCISKNRMEVSENIEKEEVEELLNLFPRSERKVVKGALMRMDLI